MRRRTDLAQISLTIMWEGLLKNDCRLTRIVRLSETESQVEQYNSIDEKWQYAGSMEALEAYKLAFHAMYNHQEIE